MANIGSFNAQSVEPAMSFEPLPTGWYNVQIVDSEVKPTKNKPDNFYLEITLEVLDGDYKGRKLWDRINIHNDNPTAKEIAWRTMSSICRATGVIQLEDTQQLHNIPMMARAIRRPATAEFDESNDIRGYKPIGGGIAPGAPAGGSAPPPWSGGQPTTPAQQPHAPPQQSQAQAPTGWTPPPPQAEVPKYPPEAIEWAKQNQNHPEAVKILSSIQPPPPPPAKPAWTPPAAPTGGNSGSTPPPWLRPK